MKITSGIYRGIILNSPKDKVVRPTLAKTRQAVFNMLRPFINGAVVADFFAGTGAYGFEALSNGAAKAVFVDASNGELIRQNASKLKLPSGRWEHIKMDFRQASGKLKGLKAGILIADPPYNRGFINTVLKLARINDILDRDGIAVMEMHRDERKDPALAAELVYWNVLKWKNYGETVVLALDIKKQI
ncbi:MAG: RsmD family RNA methyltransferase [Spirochaetia bacterium]|nr:RsmD family RNA methyltransferase [Spirochaetia bacterium]